MLRGLLHLRQGRPIMFMRGQPLQARMRTLRVVPAQVVSDVRAGRAHAIVDLRVDAFVFDAAPQALHKDVVPPSAAPVHGQLAAAGQDCVGELDRGELAALVGVDDLGLCSGQRPARSLPWYERLPA